MTRQLPGLPQPQALPHSEEAERAVLGAVLMDDGGTLGVLASLKETLAPADFYFEKHQLAWWSMLEIAKASGPEAVDIRTVQAHLEAEGKLDAVGGFAYLSGLDLSMPDIGRFELYAGIVKDRSTRRRAIQLGGELIRQSLDGTGNGNGHFPAAVREITGKLGQILAERERPEETLLSAAQVADAAWDYFDREGEALQGVRTGIPKLDAIIEAMEPGKMWLLAARPSVGKTALLVDLAFREAARLGHGALICSLEQPARELLIRRAASELNIPYPRMRTHNCSKEHYRQLIQWFGAMHERRLWIDESGGLPFGEIATRAKRAKDAHPEISLIGIDHASLILKSNPDVYASMREIMEGSANLAKALGVTIVLLHHPKGTTKGRPALGDLSYTDGKEAEGVLFLHREPAEKGTSRLSPQGEAIVAKNRGGETGEVDLYFDGEHMVWREVEWQQRELPEEHQRYQ